MIKNTTLETFKQIQEEGLLSEKRLRVYEIIYEYGALTGAQISEIYQTKYPSAQHSETIRNRITELIQMNVVKEAGMIVCDKTKRTVNTYLCTNELPAKIQKKTNKKQVVLYALQKVEVIAKKVDDIEVKEELRKLWKSLNYLHNNI